VTTAWVAIGVSSLAVGIALIAFVSSEVRWRKERERQRAIGPAPDIRAAVTDARERFRDIIAVGEKKTSYFLEEQNRDIGQRLHDLAERPGDARLSTALAQIAETWRNAFAVARAEATQRPTPDPQIGPLLEGLQTTVAHRGEDLCEVALSRLNELERL
jgi:hypothetical protein